MNVGDITVIFVTRRPCLPVWKISSDAGEFVTFLVSFTTLKYVISSSVQTLFNLIHCDILEYVIERSFANKTNNLFFIIVYTQKLLVSRSVEHRTME
jgi:hypothetical protein